MFSRNNLSIIFGVLLGLSFTAKAQQPTFLYHVCPNTTTFLTNSTYQANLNQLFTSLSSNANNTIGFYNVSSGRDPDDVYGLFLCRGDVSTDVCQNCVAFAAQDISKRCPIEKEATVWYDECLLRYSNLSFFSTVDTNPMIYMSNGQNISDQVAFNQLLATTMNNIAAEASSAPSGAKKISVREANFSGFQNLYSLVQCSGDLSSSGCAQCLQIAISNLPSCCSGKQGGRVLTPSCNVRYEIYPFYNATALEAPAAPPSPEVAPPPPPPTGSGTKPTAEGEVDYTVYLSMA